ncbi:MULTISPECIES: TetR/AcrR family transcriptional regulator [unclassified Streptosporangium]|uniref:TetR/AcrR family transcriptional regulator n=1 Tax=unclassified Streptosporangium TaxID=2632669 RepID=UPI002E2C880A|nr:MULTISPECIES: TetR/AcrR family transcriptional regulator [unclassified Streptosporangium]
MTTTKGEATKRRILEAAVDLLVAGGAARLNLDEVMHVTKTSKGQLFHYFPGGKDELHRAATERQLERLTDYGMPASLLTWEDWEDWFGQIIGLHAQQSQDDACEVAALAGRALDSNPDERVVIGRVFTYWDEVLRERLEAMRNTGLLGPGAPVEQLSSLVISALEGGAVLDKATGSTKHLANALNQTLFLLRAHGA